MLYFNQNFGNEFLGSSNTLINSSALKSLDPMDEDEIIFDLLFEGLKIFEESKPGHNSIFQGGKILRTVSHGCRRGYG